MGSITVTPREPMRDGLVASATRISMGASLDSFGRENLRELLNLDFQRALAGAFRVQSQELLPQQFGRRGCLEAVRIVGELVRISHASR